MKNKLKYILPLLLLLAVLAPDFALAQGAVGEGLTKVRGAFGGLSGLTTSGNVWDLIARIIRLLLGIAGALAVVFLIIGGYFYITSAGNAEQAEKGKNTVVNAVIGIAVIALSYVVVNVLVNFLTR